MCVQVPPKSRAALQVNEARLALLLQAVRTSLQLQSSGHSFRLAAVEIIAQLARCQVKGLLWSIRRFTAMALHQPSSKQSQLPLSASLPSWRAAPLHTCTLYSSYSQKLGIRCLQGHCCTAA